MDSVIVSCVWGCDRDLVGPASAETRRSVPLGIVSDVEPVVTRDAVWVGHSGDPLSSEAPGTLLRVDPDTGALVAEVQIPGGLVQDWGAGATDNGAWYVTKGNPVRLVRVDDATNALGATVDAPKGTTCVGVALGSLWVGGDTGSVSRLDPSTGAVQATIPTAVTNMTQVRTDGDQVWVFGHNSQAQLIVAHVDGRTNQLL